MFVMEKYRKGEREKNAYTFPSKTTLNILIISFQCYSRCNYITYTF